MHSELKRIIPGAKNAVLSVHGINATPRFFDEYVAVLPADFSVHNIRLPGHGGTVKDFGRHSSKEWEAHVRTCLDELRASHERVYIVAHSLGTLLSIREAFAMTPASPGCCCSACRCASGRGRRRWCATSAKA